MKVAVCPIVTDWLLGCAEICGDADIVKLKDAVTFWAGVLESVTCTVRVESLVVVVGTPEIVPVDASSVRPPGSEPLLIAHDTGGKPPDA